MSHAAHHDPSVPRGALISAAAVLGFAMLMTGGVRLGLIPQSADPTASRAAEHVAAAETRDLRFADRADGAVIVSDAKTGQTVTVVPFGQGGFLRATMRRMAKARAAAGVGSQPAFTLTRWENGALSLKDPQTGREAEIYGFGPDHTKAFADMLAGNAK
jgi:putative photosynthetic complex assembly protein